MRFATPPKTLRCASSSSPVPGAPSRRGGDSARWRGGKSPAAGPPAALAAEIATQPPEAVRATKRLLLATRADAIHAARAREDRAFTERIGSAENVDAIAAFFAKR